jgi:flagellar protein FliO/FliZ
MQAKFKILSLLPRGVVMLMTAIGCALASLPAAALPATSPGFAAPTQFSTPSPGLGTVRVVLALALVLGAVFAAAAVLRRLRLMSAGATPQLQVVAQVSLGARERAVLLRVAGQQLLVGVAPGAAPGDDPVPPAATAAAADAAASRPGFAELLRRSLGR